MDPTGEAFADSLASAFRRAVDDFAEVESKVQTVGGYLTEGAQGFEPLADDRDATVVAFAGARRAGDLQGMRRLLGHMESLAKSARAAFIDESGDSTVGPGAAAEEAKEAAIEAVKTTLPYAAIFAGVIVVGLIWIYGPRR